MVKIERGYSVAERSIWTSAMKFDRYAPSSAPLWLVTYSCPCVCVCVFVCRCVCVWCVCVREREGGGERLGAKLVTHPLPL